MVLNLWSLIPPRLAVAYVLKTQLFTPGEEEMQSTSNSVYFHNLQQFELINEMPVSFGALEDED